MRNGLKEVRPSVQGVQHRRLNAEYVSPAYPSRKVTARTKWIHDVHAADRKGTARNREKVRGELGQECRPRVVPTATTRRLIRAMGRCGRLSVSTLLPPFLLIGRIGCAEAGKDIDSCLAFRGH